MSKSFMINYYYKKYKNLKKKYKALLIKYNDKSNNTNEDIVNNEQLFQFTKIAELSKNVQEQTEELEDQILQLSNFSFNIKDALQNKTTEAKNNVIALKKFAESKISNYNK